MNLTANASQEYLKNAVMTAGPEQLHLMLLDGAIRFASRGVDAVTGGDIEGSFVALERAQRIVLELSNGLRREPNPALVDQMSALYNFIYRRLVDANMNRDATAAEESLRILRHQRETWVMLIGKISADSEPTPAPPKTSVLPADSARPSFSVEG